jgi:hypothetical protein
MAQLTQVQTFIHSNHGQVSHILSHQAVIAVVPTPAVQQLSQLAEVAHVYTETISVAELGQVNPALFYFMMAWNNLLLPPAPAVALNRSASQHHEDALLAPDQPLTPTIRSAGANSSKPGYYQTSEFLAGSVAVGIILVESDGSIDPSSENWTDGEKQQIFSEIMAGLNWWATLDPRAHVSFVYNDHFSAPLPTGVEPITRSSTDQRYWINDALGALGYQSSSYFTRVRDYNNSLRDFYHTDWAFTIFVVDSAEDGDNYFSDGRFAYAYLGGPFLVMTSGNNGYGIDNMDAVLAHEVGHIFYALDQYSGANQECTRRSGYLSVENFNSQAGSCPLNVNSIMRGQVYPYQTKSIDPYAAGQIGWRDSDQDNILDPLEADLPLIIEPLILQDNRIMVTGQAEIVPYPSPGHASVTINTLTQVKYRLDQTNWQSGNAVDGAFDDTEEAFQFVSAQLSPGLHTLEVATVDSAGNVSAPMFTQALIITDAVNGSPNIHFFPVDQAVSQQTFTLLNGAAYHTHPDGIIDRVDYRLNGGLWQPAQAQDSLFDSNLEPFVVSIALETGQHYLIEALATDTEGNTSSSIASYEIKTSRPFFTYLPSVGNGM